MEFFLTFSVVENGTIPFMIFGGNIYLDQGFLIRGAKSVVGEVHTIILRKFSSLQYLKKIFFRKTLF